MTSDRPALTESRVRQLARFARLELTAERAEVLAPTANGIYQLIDQLDTAEVADEPPATAFDARWD